MDENALLAGNGYGTHLPSLIEMVLRTTGPVLEMGAGAWSTPVLHWLVARRGRILVTVEENCEWLATAAAFTTCPDHRIYDSYDAAIVEDGPLAQGTEPARAEWRDACGSGTALATPVWDVVLIDHAADRRQRDLMRLTNRARFLVVHDACAPDVYHYDFSSFAFRRHDPFGTGTMIVSQFEQP